MNKRFLKRIVALATAATLVLGNSVIAFADEVDNMVGQGTYEGTVADAQYLTITLPTADDNQFDFVADPNQLISKWASGGGSNFNFDAITGTDTGIYFATRSGSTLKLSNSSLPLEAINKNYQDSDISVEVSIKTAGTNTPKFTSATSSWTGEKVTAKELYLAAMADGKNISGSDYIDTGKAAKLSFTVSGSPANYTTDFTTTAAVGTAAFDETRQYFITASSAAVYDDNSLWATGGFHLTGAINKGADWTEGFTMPELKVVWSIAEHISGGVDVNSVVLSGSDLYVKLFADNSSVKSSKLTSVTVNGVSKTATVLTNGVISVSGGAPSAGTYNVVVVYDGTTYKGTATK